MKIFLILLLITAAACTRDAIGSAPPEPETQPQPKPEPFAWKPGDSYAWWGDSFSEAPGALPPSWFMAQRLGQDSMYLGNVIDSTGRQNYGWHLRRKDSVVYNAGYSGMTSTFIKDRFLEHSGVWSRVQIFWVGRNNAWDTAIIAKDLDEMIGKLGHKKYVVVGILTGDWDYERPGTPYYNNVHAFNEWLSKKYEKHFVDPLPSLLAKSDGSAEDKRCVANNVTPASARLDQLHLSGKGCQAVGETVAALLNELEKNNYN